MLAVVAAAALLAGCAPFIHTSEWQKTLGSENLLIIKTPPGNPPIVIRKEGGEWA